MFLNNSTCHSSLLECSAHDSTLYIVFNRAVEPGLPSAAAVSLHPEKVPFGSDVSTHNFNVPQSGMLKRPATSGVYFRTRKLCQVVARQLAAAVGE